jgi:hypothetical protein
MSRPLERQAVSTITSKLAEITEYLENNTEPNAQDGGDFLKPLLENFKAVKRISEERVNALKEIIQSLDEDYENNENNYNNENNENNNNEQNGGKSRRKHKSRKNKVKKTRKRQ